MLEEVGRPYRTEVLEYGTTMKSPAYFAINPMGKVPAIRHGDTVVTEAAAICAYLADAFPEAGLAPPAGERLRGPYYRWLFFGAGPVEAAVTNKAMGFELPPDRKPMAGYGSLAEVMDALDGALSGRDYLVGDRFTATDLYVGAQLGWGMMFGTIEKRPAFERYFQRLSARPAAKRANELDEALMPAKAPAA
jgi:glutathione S-transferase